MFAKSAIVAFFAAFAAAQLHAPTEMTPDNAITRPLNEAVEAGKLFTITWKPSDTTHTVSLLLLKGPSSNVIPVGEPIAEGIANSGSYSWIVPSQFGPGLSETTGYGIQIIDDVNGHYQYSTQFGIDVGDDYVPSSTPSGYPTGTPSATESASGNTTATVTPTKSATSTIITSTILSNTSIILPTKSMTVPTSLITETATSTIDEELPTETSEVPESTGAASQFKAGMGVVAGVAGLFFML
ncbi:hypothetical protein M011DRAFT_457698 [Sporormia fimetaria CBS 119925]|uniref:Yeast cell wall synthesis Kre9/Knh1-like N-terminal domain-containing protein n=1 Tax=Sporormia fimetaria CBS 119925 TaxID=1340428 RepID=A0A6A6VCT2_9PLEO|nr:hypothetical protein M011DRAFT_457698 [Sporormia fimetaria CBS 119925]